ncbi:BSDC1-like protein [Mya arenaria]|uniref:BSDC1-like protein n=1 Tax=Mya arenaria TaxID=6604 RepID=A0ABY7FQB6_MYAAR|nr:BSDC1-like protein [Mya arenaria]
MAEKEKGSSEAGSWWGGLLAAAKHQTEKAMEMVSTDLAEFTSTMQNDTKKVVEKTKETLQTSGDEVEGHTASDRVKHGFFSLMEGITKALTVDPEDTEPARLPPPQPGDGIFDRAKARLRAIQVDTGTYLNDPSGSSQLYADWLKSFDIEAHKGEISELLVSMVEVRSLYTTLVPSEVSHQDFWRRYFYKLYQLSVDEARKQALMRQDEWSGDEDGPRLEPAREDPSSRLQPGSVGADNDDMPSGKSGEHENKKAEQTDGDMGAVKDKPSEVEASSHVKLKDTKTKKNVNVQRAMKSGDRTVFAEPTNVNQDKVIQTSEISVKSVVIAQEKSSEVETQVKGQVNDNSETSVIACDTNDDKTVNDTHKREDEITVVKEVTEPVNEMTVVKEVKEPENEMTVVKEVTEPENVMTVVKEVTEPENEMTVVKEVTEPENEMTMVKEVTEPVKNVTEVTESMATGTSKMATDVIGVIEDGIGALKTKVKGDMVVVGDRISPSSESSENKESVTEDWEQDFDDVEVTAEDLQAAHQLAEKLNMSATEYNTLTGEEEEDWENWE